MQVYTFDCGCEFPILKQANNSDELPLLDVRFDQDFPFCKKTWDLLSSGYTKGIFQLESPLGRQWAKRIKPNCPEHMSALGALLRPGCLKGLDEEGISITEHYCRRRNDEEKIESLHPLVDEALKSTYGCMAYQEQMLKIAEKLAGFNLVEQDSLRKGVGKKLESEVAKVGILFIEKASTFGVVSKQEAESIWEIIKKSGRYLFNKSHSMSYGLTGYDTAYLKSHFPLQFYTACLKWSSERVNPTEEVRELINDSSIFGIKVLTPDFRKLNQNFKVIGKDILFGLTNVSGIGDSTYHKVIKTVQNLNISEMKWHEFLCRVCIDLPFSVLQKLILVGGLDWLWITRNRMVEESRIVNEVIKGTSKVSSYIEQWIKENYQKAENICSLLVILLETHPKLHKSRAKTIEESIRFLKNPPKSLEDDIEFVINNEIKYLGVSLTHTSLDKYDTTIANTTVQELHNGKDEKNMVLAVEIDEVKFVISKAGNEMYILTIRDSCSIDGIFCWKDVYNKYSELLFNGNRVLISVEKTDKKKLLCIKNVQQLECNESF